MPRTNEADVKALIGDSCTGAGPYILAANAVVNANLLNRGLSEDVLKQIECWLAAHFYSLVNEQETRTKVGPFAVDYSREGLRLEETRFGAGAKMLDASGTLQTLNKPKATFRVL